VVLTLPCCDCLTGGV
jgi:hypothetical protein